MKNLSTQKYIADLQARRITQKNKQIEMLQERVLVLEEACRRLGQQASTDRLTGLKNRQALERHLDQLFAGRNAELKIVEKLDKSVKNESN